MLVVRCLAHMAAADWTTGAVDGRRLVLHTCGKCVERALGTFLDSTGGSITWRKSCLRIVYIGNGNPNSGCVS